MENIAKAIINVMAEVKGIEKSMTVGSGTNAYQGVPDKEVKKVVGEAMAKHGLCILPIGVTPRTEVSRWEETNQYGTKQKQSVFTEVTTKYLLLHESGESIELEGYGHGVDSQDKGAGKATTYALKYTLLYSFLVPTGKIDDADAIHSDTTEAAPAARVEDARPWLVEKQFTQAMERITNGEAGVFEKIERAFRMKNEYKQQLTEAEKGVLA